METSRASVAVVLPCYKVASHIQEVISLIPDSVSHIVVVDDGCPQGSGKLVQDQVKDPRVTVLFNKTNQGVGGAMIAGY